MTEELTNIATEATAAAVGAIATATQVQAAVATQTSVFGKILAGLDEFLAVAPTVAGAVDPAIAGASTAIASLLQTIVTAAAAFHTATVVPAASKTGAAP